MVKVVCSIVLEICELLLQALKLFNVKQAFRDFIWVETKEVCERKGKGEKL